MELLDISLILTIFMPDWTYKVFGLFCYFYLWNLMQLTTLE